MRVLQRITMHWAILGKSCAGLFLLGGAWWALRSRTVQFTFDPVLARDIKDAITLRYTDNPMAARPLLACLKKESPAISDITLKKTPGKIAQAQIFADRPYVKIKTPLAQYALTKRGTICPVSDFNAYYLDGLPHITLNDQHALEHLKADTVWQKLVDVNRSLFESFDVSFTAPTHIALCSKKYKHLLIMADIENIDNFKRFEAVEKIYNQKKGDSLKKGLKFDIRLHDAIVCAPLKAGEL